MAQVAIPLSLVFGIIVDLQTMKITRPAALIGAKSPKPFGRKQASKVVNWMINIESTYLLLRRTHSN